MPRIVEFPRSRVTTTKSSHDSQTSQDFQDSQDSQVVPKNLGTYLREHIHRISVEHDSEVDSSLDSRMFNLVRAVKTRAEFMGLTGRQAITVLKENGLPLNRFGEDLMAEFIRAWNKVKIPLGVHPLDVAFERALTSPRWPRDEEMPSYSLFKNVLAYLWENRDGTKADIYFAQKDMAQRIEVCQRTVSTYCEMAAEEGYIHRMSKGSNFTRKASCYRVDMSKIPKVDFTEPLKESVKQVETANAKKWKVNA